MHPLFEKAEQLQDAAIYFDDDTDTLYLFTKEGEIIASYPGLDYHSLYYDQDSVFHQGMAILYTNSEAVSSMDHEVSKEAWRVMDYFIINEAGNMIHKGPFQDVNTDCLAGDSVRVKYKGKYGFIKKDGSWKLPPEWDLVENDDDYMCDASYICLTKGQQKAVFSRWLHPLVPLNNKGYKIAQTESYFKSEWDMETICDIAYYYRTENNKLTGGYLEYFWNTGVILKEFRLPGSYEQVEYDDTMRGFWINKNEDLIYID